MMYQWKFKKVDKLHKQEEQEESSHYIKIKFYDTSIEDTKGFKRCRNKKHHPIVKIEINKLEFLQRYKKDLRSLKAAETKSKKTTLKIKWNRGARGHNRYKNFWKVKKPQKHEGRKNISLLLKLKSMINL